MEDQNKNVIHAYGYQGTQPNFSRDQYATLADMKAVTSIDDGHISFCLEDKKTYQYISTNEVDATTGKWRLLTQASGGASGELPITFVKNFDEYKALPEDEKRKSNHMFVIGFSETYR